MRVKTISNTNLVTSRYVERENGSLPVDMRHSMFYGQTHPNIISPEVMSPATKLCSHGLLTLNPVFKYTFLKFSRFRDYVSKCELTPGFGRDDFRALTVTVWLYDLLWLATVVLLSSLPRQAHEESTTIKHNYNQPCPCTLQISIFKFFKTKDGPFAKIILFQLIAGLYRKELRQEANERSLEGSLGK